MRHYSARQRQSDGRWDYTCGSRPVGYCCEFKPIAEDGTILPAEHARQWNAKIAPLAGNFHTDGHATEEEACECYKRYILDVDLRLMPEEPKDASSQHRCQVCKEFTACYAMVGCYRMFNLCPTHQTREEVEKLLKVGESWES